MAWDSSRPLLEAEGTASQPSGTAPYPPPPTSSAGAEPHGQPFLQLHGVHSWEPCFPRLGHGAGAAGASHVAAVAKSSGALGVALLWLGGYRRHPSLNPAPGLLVCWRGAGGGED